MFRRTAADKVVLMETVIATIVVLLLAFGLISLRILFVKDGEFKGTCSTNNPMLAKKLGPCVACGKKRGEPCLKEAAKQL